MGLKLTVGVAFGVGALGAVAPTDVVAVELAAGVVPAGGLILGSSLITLIMWVIQFLRLNQC